MHLRKYNTHIINTHNPQQMKKLLFTLTLCFASLLTWSQNNNNISLEWGKEVEIKKRSTISDIVATTADGIYVYKYKIKGALIGKYIFFLEHYDNRYSLKKSVEFELKYQKKDLQLEKFVFMNGRLYAFSTFKNQKTKKYYLFSQSINLKTLLPNKDLKKVAEISYQNHSRWNTGTYSFDFSTDSTKLLVSYSLPYQKKTKEKFGFHVFDQDMNLLWKKNIVLPYLEELFAIKKMKVDNEGNAYFVGKLFREKTRNRNRTGNPNYDYLVLSYSKDNAQANEYKIQLKEKFITDLQVDIAPNKDIVCAGFYSNESSYAVKGSFYLSIDNEQKTVNKSSYKEFGMDFITHNMTAKQEKKAKKKESKGKNIEMYNYDLDEMIMRSDGGVMLVAEQYFVSVHTYTTSNGNGGRTTHTTYTYYYNDIIVINISPEGIIDWMVTIPKYQVSTNDRGFFSSYVLSVVGNKLHFVFNDHPENLDFKKGDKIMSPYYSTLFSKGKKGSILTVVSVDPKGNYTREALPADKNSIVITRPKVCKQVSNNELIIYGQKKKTQQFGKVTFK